MRVDGQKSVYLPVMKQGGDTNTIAVVDGVRGILSKLVDIPKELVTKVVFDQSEFVKSAIETLLHEGGIGLLLTGSDGAASFWRVCARRSPCFFPFRFRRWRRSSVFISAAAPSTRWCWRDWRLFFPV